MTQQDEQFQELYDQALLAQKTSDYNLLHELLQQLEASELDQLSRIRIANMRIGYYLHRGEYKTALPISEKYVSICQQMEGKIPNKIITQIYQRHGSLHYFLSNYSQAIHWYDKSIEFQSSKSEGGRNLSNKGNVHWQLSDHQKALELYEESLKLSSEIKDLEGAADTIQNIGNIYFDLGEMEKSLEYYHRAMDLFREQDKPTKLGIAIYNASNVYAELGQHDKAIEFADQASSISESVGDTLGVALAYDSIAHNYQIENEFDKALFYYQKFQTLGAEIGIQGRTRRSLINLAEIFMHPEYEGRDEEKAEHLLVELLSDLDTSDLKPLKKAEVCRVISELYRAQGRYKEALEKTDEYHRRKEEAIAEEDREKARNYEHRTQIENDERDRQVNLARHQEQEIILHKVLPKSVANRMLDGDEQIADYYTSASILFADIQGFTPLTADLPPYMLLQLLHEVFSRFDAIVKRHGCTKIKTIGDGYMAVSGAPEAIEDHAERIVKAAFEMIQPIEIPADIEAFLPDGAELKVRVGIHVGPIVAGVVGQDAFGYDIYSDAVNIASRMETTGEANRIHVSADFMRHLLSRFNMTKNTDHGIQFEKRGEIEVKGKGMMKTFYLAK